MVQTCKLYACDRRQVDAIVAGEAYRALSWQEIEDEICWCNDDYVALLDIVIENTEGGTQ